MGSVPQRGRSATRAPFCPTNKLARQGSQPTQRGFVVWLSAPNGKTRGFITWAETAVAELSPAIQDAWQFPTAQAANDSVSRAFGAQAEDYGVAVFPASQ